MHGPRGLIIGISGALGSGKSTLAKALADTFDGRTASFSSYVIHLIGSDYGVLPRIVLQDVGERLVRENPTAFVSGFLVWAEVDAGKPLIIDGVRHISVDRELRQWASLAGRSYLSVALSATPEERAVRRTGGDLKALALLDHHPVEFESKSLLTNADIVAPLDWDVAQMVDEIAAILTQSLDDNRSHN